MPENADGHSIDEPGGCPDIERLAALCSVGAAPIPDDLANDQQQQLMLAIAKRRRKRLIHLIAAAIADDIWRERQSQE